MVKSFLFVVASCAFLACGCVSRATYRRDVGALTDLSRRAVYLSTVLEQENKDLREQVELMSLTEEGGGIK